MYQDKKKEWRWTLRANNGKIVADSAESYKRKRACVKGMMLTKDLTNIIGYKTR